MSEEKTILQLAKEHQVACWMGKYKISGKARKYRDKDVTCIMCGRPMTAPEWEKEPFYCYKCDEEAEAIQRDGVWKTPDEDLARGKEKKNYEDYFNGKVFTTER